MWGSMRTGRIAVKISILSALACANGSRTGVEFGVPGPDSRDADIRAVQEEFGLQIRYLGALRLPQGVAEQYELGARGGILVYLPVAETSLLSFATARRFLTPAGERMTEIEREVATELWRAHLDDPRRRTLYGRGADVEHRRSGEALYELVHMPLFDPARDGAATISILEQEVATSPELLLERVLSRATEAESERGAEDESLAASSLIAGKAALSSLGRTRDADAVVLMGPMGRRAALAVGLRWLGAARSASKSQAEVSRTESQADADRHTENSSSFLVRFPIPTGAGRRAQAEMATRWLGSELARSPPGTSSDKDAGSLRVRKLRLDYASSTPSLDVLVEFPRALSSSAASSLLGAHLRSRSNARLELTTRSKLAEQAESERRESIEGPLPLVFTLLAAALAGELESLDHSVAATRPGALTTWLSAVLRIERAHWTSLPSSKAVEP